MPETGHLDMRGVVATLNLIDETLNRFKHYLLSLKVLPPICHFANKRWAATYLHYNVPGGDYALNVTVAGSHSPPGSTDVIV